MIIFLLSIVDAVVVPLTQTNSIRVFCFTDKANDYDVSFSPDKECAHSCGYYDSQNTCCTVWVVTEDTVVRCYQSGQTKRTLEFTATIIPTLGKQYRNKTQSELICVKDGKDQYSHSSETGFYMKYAYLYDGIAKQFDPFFNLELIKLPADESEVECNKTSYAFHGLPDQEFFSKAMERLAYNMSLPDPRLSKIYQRVEIMMIMMIISILGLIFYLIYTHGGELVANLYK